MDVVQVGHFTMGKQRDKHIWENRLFLEYNKIHTEKWGKKPSISDTDTANI